MSRWDAFSKEEILTLWENYSYWGGGDVTQILGDEIKEEYYKRLRQDKVNYFPIRNAAEWNAVSKMTPLIPKIFHKDLENYLPEEFPKRLWNILEELPVVEWSLESRCYFHSERFLVVGESHGKEIIFTRDGRYSNSSDYLFIHDHKIVCRSDAQKRILWTWYRFLANERKFPDILLAELLTSDDSSIRKAAKEISDRMDDKIGNIYVGGER